MSKIIDWVVSLFMFIQILFKFKGDIFAAQEYVEDKIYKLRVEAWKNGVKLDEE